MSNEALSWAWTVPCPPTAKLVLLSIADRANAAGECFPSVRDMVARTGLKERAIQYAMRELERGGWLRREFRAGRANIYVVSLNRQTPAADAPPHEMHPRSTCTGGVHQMHQGGASDAGGGCTTCTHNHHLTHIEPTPNPQRGADAAAPSDTLTLTPDPKPAQKRRGEALPRDWWPSPAAEAFACERGLNVKEAVAEFRDYWCGVPGARGLKLDWDGTFRNRCRLLATRPKPKLHTLPLAEQNQRIFAAVGLGFTDPPQATEPVRRIAQ